MDCLKELEKSIPDVRVCVLNLLEKCLELKIALQKTPIATYGPIATFSYAILFRYTHQTFRVVLCMTEETKMEAFGESTRKWIYNIVPGGDVYTIHPKALIDAITLFLEWDFKSRMDLSVVGLEILPLENNFFGVEGEKVAISLRKEDVVKLQVCFRELLVDIQ